MKPTYVIISPDWECRGVQGKVHFQFAGSDYYADREGVPYICDAYFDIVCNLNLKPTRIAVALPNYQRKYINVSDENRLCFSKFVGTCKEYIQYASRLDLIKSKIDLKEISWLTDVDNCLELKQF